MNSSSPLVSIIIPTYNRRDLLNKTLQSVVLQDYNNWECLIIDEGSKDGTEEMVRAFVLEDKRFKYHIKPAIFPKGACHSRNIGFGLSKGDYIQWLDDDDLLSKNKLLCQVQRLEKLNNKSVYATCSWDHFWFEKPLDLKNSFNENIIKKDQFFKRLGEEQSFVPPTAYLISRELAIKSGSWNTELSINQDAEYFTRVLVNSDYLVNVKNCYVLYRQHDGERISARRDYSNVESFFLSLNLIQSYLKSYDIEAKNYFKWKLLKWFLAYRKIYPALMKKHYYLFRENGLDINYSFFYSMKYSVYKVIYPIYKKIKH